MYPNSKIKEVLIIVGIGLVCSLLLSFLSGWGLLMLVNLVGFSVKITFGKVLLAGICMFLIGLPFTAKINIKENDPW